MSLQERNREVASFFYAFNGPQEIEFDVFLKLNKKWLSKISQYEYKEWSEAIELGDSLEESLCFLLMNFGRKYSTLTASSVKARLHLLQIWERNWGAMPTKWRLGFIRHKKFDILGSLDLELLEYLFTQHRKFDSIIVHLFSLQRHSESYQLMEDFLSADDPMDTYGTYEEFAFFDDESISTLASEMSIGLDWNLDELDSEAILLTWDEDESY